MTDDIDTMIERAVRNLRNNGRGDAVLMNLPCLTAIHKRLSEARRDSDISDKTIAQERVRASRWRLTAIALAILNVALAALWWLA